MKTILLNTVVGIFCFIAGVNSAPVKDQAPTVNVKAAQNVVLYFNAQWNAQNHYSQIDRLTNCTVQKVMIDQQPQTQKTYKVTQVPCIILFKNGVEIKRWEPGLSLKITAPLQTIQSEIK